MPRIELFPFRYRCPRTGEWHRARYVAELHEIAERHPEGWEIIGPAEVRNVNPDARYFSPHPKLMTNADLRRYEEAPPVLTSAADATEAFLLVVFLRRYVTYCARHGRYAAMNGAARLYADLKGTPC